VDELNPATPDAGSPRSPAPDPARLAGALARDIVKVADADLEQHLEAFWRLPGQAA